MEISSYPRVWGFDNRFAKSIYDGKWHVEEKVDGSQISFESIGGLLSMRSKGRQIVVDAPEGMFAKAVNALKNNTLLEKHGNGYVFRGEYLQKKKHNTIDYDRTPKHHIIIYDIEVKGNPLGYAEKLDIASACGFEAVPLLLEGEGTPPGDEIKRLFELESVLGGHKIEGVVIKNYSIPTDDGKYLLAKIVSEAFREKHKTEWKKKNLSQSDVTTKIIEELVTDARFDKAFQRLKENGTPVESMSCTGAFLKEIHRDIDEEELDYIAGRLLAHFIPKIKRGVCGSAPRWLRDRLESPVTDTRFKGKLW